MDRAVLEAAQRDHLLQQNPRTYATEAWKEDATIRKALDPNFKSGLYNVI